MPDEKIDYQAEYLQLLNENKSLKERNEELFKVIISFNGQKPLINEGEKTGEPQKEKFQLKDIKF